MQHHNIGHGQGVPLEICRVVDIKSGIDAFQIVLFCQRGGVDQFIVLRLYGKTIVADGIQRLKAVIQCFIAAFFSKTCEIALTSTPIRSTQE